MTQPAMTVSVVMPVFNGARYLGDALASVLAQSRPAHEIVVVDDGSSDTSADIVAQTAAGSPIPIHYVYQNNQGPAAARNSGIELASGQIIAFLDQDDLWLPEKLSRQVDHMDRQPGAGYSITLFNLLLSGIAQWPAWVRPELLERPHPGFTPSCLAVRRATFDAVGLFEVTLLTAYDTDWFSRAFDAAVEMALVPEVLTLYRIHATNQSRAVGMNKSFVLRAARTSVMRKHQARTTVDVEAGSAAGAAHDDVQ